VQAGAAAEPEPVLEEVEGEDEDEVDVPFELVLDAVLEPEELLAFRLPEELLQPFANAKPVKIPHAVNIVTR
jgi:hypothetical protein